MSSNEVKFSFSSYNIFSICEDFRQRLACLQRLKEKVLNEKKKRTLGN